MKTNNQFKFIKTKLPGVFLIKKFQFIDNRGLFIKAYSHSNFKSKNINSNFKESYYSCSYKNVIRGMHFQKYPATHSKLVTVVHGKILDVCLNVKKKNKEYGKFFRTILSSDNNASIYIPGGYAHGFLVLSEFAIVLVYMTSSYNSKYEDGVHYNSFGYKWPINKPILSEKDNNLKKFKSL
jgi:dTDP-4-dehydrorhamnose 3,5-epimerase